MEIDLESRCPFRLAGQPPANTALDAPAPEVVATMRAAARRNAEYAAAKPPPLSTRRLGEPLAEPTADVRSARGRCAQLAIDGVRRRAEATQLRKELGQPPVTNPTEEPALTPLVAGVKARAAKISAYAEAISSEPKPAAPGVPITARVASLRKALPAPAWSWVPLPPGPKLVGCGDPAKLVELSMVRMGEGSLRYAIVFGGLVPKTGSPSAATLALHLTAVTSARAVAAAAAAAAAAATAAAGAAAPGAAAAVPVRAPSPSVPAAAAAAGAADQDGPAARSWQALSFSPGEAPAARCAHAAVAWGPHRMLVHGGEGACPVGGRPPLLADVHALLVSRGAASDGRGARCP